jgi:hypothetical protein
LSWAKQAWRPASSGAVIAKAKIAKTPLLGVDQMATDQVLKPEIFRDPDVFYHAVVRVTRPDELPAALRQRTKPVVIENDELERRFSALERWHTIRLFGIGVIVATLLTIAMALQYKLDLSWSYHWKIGRLDGKITLTPTQRP